MDLCRALGSPERILEHFKQKPGRKRPIPGDVDTVHEPEPMERKRQDVEQAEREPKQDADQIEQAEREPEQDAEQMIQAERESEQDAEQMGQDWAQTEQIEQQPKYGEQDAEQKE